IVDGFPVLVLRPIAADGFQPIAKGILEVFTEGLSAELDRASRKAKHDSSLEACGIVEKPSTAGEHQHGLSLSLQENDRLLFLGIREQPASVALEKLLEDARAGVEEHGDPVIAGRPEILQD